MMRPKDRKEMCTESWLMKIPLLGYLLKKIAEHQKPIETALKTKRKTEENINRESYLGGLITTVSGWTFDTLKLGGKDEKRRPHRR